MRFTRIAMLAVALLSWGNAAHAQVGPGYPVVHIGPLTAYCNDPLGTPVINYITPNSMGAMAAAVRGWPAIVVDPAFSANVTWEFNVFTYVHECGHHFHGHLLGAPASHWERELAADCYAARMTNQLGWLDDAAFDIAMMTLAGFPGSKTHPPGPMRVANARSCR